MNLYLCEKLKQLRSAKEIVQYPCCVSAPQVTLNPVDGHTYSGADNEAVITEQAHCKRCTTVCRLVGLCNRYEILTFHIYSTNIIFVRRDVLTFYFVYQGKLTVTHYIVTDTIIKTKKEVIKCITYNIFHKIFKKKNIKGAILNT